MQILKIMNMFFIILLPIFKKEATFYNIIHKTLALRSTFVVFYITALPKMKVFLGSNLFVIKENKQVKQQQLKLCDLISLFLSFFFVYLFVS